nr:hypothetical protein [Tanacetum cinerariifolium]
QQEAEFARQQEELAQKAQAERVALPTEHDPGLSDQRRQELDAAQLIYTEADWVELLAKIATNSALSKQLLRDDVPAASSQVPASVPTAPSFAADVLVSAATTLEVPAAESHPADTPTAFVHISVEPSVPAAESRPADTPTAFVHISVEPSVAASTPLPSRKRRKHIAKKRVTPIVDIDDAALIKFDCNSGSDDDPLPYAPYADWEMVPSPLGSVHAYYDMAGHTKHFTSLCELLH